MRQYSFPLSYHINIISLVALLLGAFPLIAFWPQERGGVIFVKAIGFFMVIYSWFHLSMSLVEIGVGNEGISIRRLQKIILIEKEKLVK